MTATEHDPKSTEIAGTLMELVTGFRASRAIYVAVKLGIPDVLTASPMSSAELAMATNAHPPSVRRLMRALSALGIFEESEPDRFRLTPTGSLLRSDVPGSLRPVSLFLAGEKRWRSWGDLLYSVQTGKTAFEHVFGMQVFDYYLSQPEECAIHDQAMAALSSAVAASVLAAYDFAGFRVVVDVGGGTGLLVAEIVAAHHHLRGVLFDLPNVVADGLA